MPPIQVDLIDSEYPDEVPLQLDLWRIEHEETAKQAPAAPPGAGEDFSQATY